MPSKKSAFPQGANETTCCPGPTHFPQTEIKSLLFFQKKGRGGCHNGWGHSNQPHLGKHKEYFGLVYTTRNRARKMVRFLAQWPIFFLQKKEKDNIKSNFCFVVNLKSGKSEGKKNPKPTTKQPSNSI